MPADQIALDAVRRPGCIAVLQTQDGHIHGVALDLRRPITMPSGMALERLVFRLPTANDFFQADRGSDTTASMRLMFELLTGHPGDVLGRLGVRDWDSAVDTINLLLDAFNDAQMRAAMALPAGTA